MSYSGHIEGSSLPYQFKIPDATENQDGVMTKGQVAKLDALPGGAYTGQSPVDINGLVVSLLSNRPKNTYFVGTPTNNTVTPDGSAIAPFPQISTALASAAAAGLLEVKLQIDPGRLYDDFTVPPSLCVWAECGLSDAQHGATVSTITVTGTPGGGFPVVFEGITATTNLHITGSGASDQAIVVIKGSGNIANVTSSPLGTVQPIVVGVGLLETSSFLASVTFGGPINVPAGFFVGQNCDVQGAVTCDLYSTIDCRNPAIINCAGTQMRIGEAEGGQSFPYGSPVITFTGAAGQAEFDAVSALNFGIAGGNIINGAPFQPAAGPRLMFCDVAFSALQVAKASSPGHVTVATGTAAGDDTQQIGMSDGSTFFVNLSRGFIA